MHFDGFCLAGVLAVSLTAFATNVAAQTPPAKEDETMRAKIAGGRLVPDGKFPFQVALMKPGMRLHCGATVIDSQWIMTAGHCVSGKMPRDLDVYVGSRTLPRPGMSGDGVIRNIDKIVPHRFDSETGDNDIALIKLVNEVPAAVPAVVWATADLEARLNIANQPVTVIGWGDTATFGDPSLRLLEVDIAIQPSNICQGNYRRIFPGMTITANMFCAGWPQGGKDACRGDSGGFLGVMDNGRWVQLGVVSAGDGCARPDFYGIYTRVGNYETWIRETMARF